MLDLFWNKQDYLKKCILVWIRKNCTGLWRELFRFALFEKFWCENCISSIWPQGQNFLGQNVSRVKVSGVKVSFEELGVKVSGVKVPLGSKCPGVKVSLGSKCPWGQSVFGVKMSVGSKCLWGQNGCEPYFFIQISFVTLWMELFSFLFLNLTEFYKGFQIRYHSF